MISKEANFKTEMTFEIFAYLTFAKKLGAISAFIVVDSPLLANSTGQVIISSSAILN